MWDENIPARPNATAVPRGRVEIPVVIPLFG